MKKLIAMVMTAAMVASLVPATAFAGDSVDATAKVINSWTKRDTFSGKVTGKEVPELELKVTNASTQGTDHQKDYEFTITLDNATFDTDGNKQWDQAEIDAMKDGIELKLANASTGTGMTGSAASWTYTDITKSSGDDEALAKLIYKNVVAGNGDWNSADDGFYLIDTKDTGWSGYTSGSAGSVEATKGITIDNYTDFGYTKIISTPASGNSAEKNRDDAWVAYWAADEKSVKTDTDAGDTATDWVHLTNGSKGAGYYYTPAGLVESLSVTDVELAKWASDNGYEGVNSSKTGFDSTEKDFTWSVKDADTYWTDATDGCNSGAYTKNGTQTIAKLTTKTGATNATGSHRASEFTVTALTKDKSKDTDEFKFKITCDNVVWEEGDIVTIDLLSVLDRTKTAYVSIDSDDMDIANGDDLVYVSIEDEGVTASIKKLANVAEEEHITLEKDLVIKATVGEFAKGQIIELKLNNGFEFTKACKSSKTGVYTLDRVDEDVIELKVVAATDKIEVAADDIEIEATDAKAGATAVITVKATNNVDGAFNAKTTVEVMKVVDYVVELSVDEDADVPVIYSGVNVKNFGINDDSDHLSLEVTAEESFPGAWSFRKGFNFELPEGVYVTDVEITDVDGFLKTSATEGAAGKADVKINKDGMTQVFFDAYQDGDHVNFEFDKRVFDDVDAQLADDEATVSFKLELVADPTFSGDVTLKLTGELVDEQEVTIAKFVKPYEVKAEQNDLKIDYRYTEVPTEIVVTEAEEGLWDKDNATFAFYVEKPDYIVFEDDPTYTVDKNSGMELDEDELKKGYWDGGNTDFEAIHFTVDKESDEAATVTISDLSLFMQRSIPAGAYDLKIWTSMADKYEAQVLFAPDCADSVNDTHSCTDKDNDCIVGDVCDYSEVVKEAFVNVVTAGREQDDASFTTKVVVPVGENKIVAGETEYTIDAPAYINANGYTMLPVRAVAVALGINNNNVLWDQATKTVTILYGQRIITMQVGASVVYVNGAALPASSSVEITNNRTFLGLRDLATALGVTDITWDASTKTATLNGGNTAE